MKANRVYYVVCALVTAIVLLACSLTTRMTPGENTTSLNQTSEVKDSQPKEISGTWKQLDVPGLTDNKITYLINGDKLGNYYYLSTATGGTGKPETLMQPASIWRTRDGLTWEMVGKPGFGDSRNWNFKVHTWQKRLYVLAMQKDIFSMWVSENGENFNQIRGDWTEKGYPSLSVIDNKLFLFIGSNIEEGVQAWSSSNGERFELVFEKGLDNPANADVINFHKLELESLKGWTFLGIRNLTEGGEIWRTKDGQKWEKSVTGGIDDPSNGGLMPLLVYKDYLYASVPPYNYQLNSKGVNVFRMMEGDKWENIVEDGFGLGEHQATWAWMMVYHDSLYLVTTNDDPRAASFTPTGFRLWKSLDGKSWQQVGEPGFGNPNNFMITMSIIRDVFYLGTYNIKDGNQLWRSTDGENWEQFFSAPASETNQGGGVFEVGNSLIFNTNDPVQGIQIWRYEP